MKKITEEILENVLPSGSGFNCDWEIDENEKFFLCKSSFHPRTEHGFYDRYADFTVIIPKESPENFKLQFNGSDSQYMNKKHMLREYMEDTVFYSLFPNS